MPYCIALGPGFIHAPIVVPVALNTLFVIVRMTMQSLAPMTPAASVAAVENVDGLSDAFLASVPADGADARRCD
jgi:hypothetical protein